MYFKLPPAKSRLFSSEFNALKSRHVLHVFKVSITTVNTNMECFPNLEPAQILASFG